MHDHLNLTTTQHQRISSFERRANELIFGSSPKKVPKVASLTKMRMCNLVFDCLNGNVCSNFVNYYSDEKAMNLFVFQLLKLNCQEKVISTEWSLLTICQ